MVFLGVVSVWAIVNMYQDERVKMAEMHTQMKPAYTYFDANRVMSPVSDMQMMYSTTALPTSCPADHPRLSLYTYEGNNAGYKTANSEYASGTTTAVGATTVNAHGSVNAHFMGGVQFCAKRMRLNTFTAR